MAKCEVVFFPDLSVVPPPLSGVSETETDPLKVIVLQEADRSDVLNEFVVVSLRVGSVGMRSTVKRDPAAVTATLEAAIAGLILAALDNAPVIRDAITQEKATHGEA